MGVNRIDPAGTSYRRDIDGLRAIAVIPVVLYHANNNLMPGGYVGVDVFFVISGYLITALILKDITRNRFSIALFYERRARRILPALFGILVFATIAAAALFLPSDLRLYGATLAATTLFSSNFLFLSQSGYFDQAADTKPLLHTWSLAVEEQFYILYPLFLWLVHRFFGRRYAIALGAVCFASLGLSIWGVAAHPSAAFYLAPTRAWELLIGGILATESVPAVRATWLVNAVSLAGLAMIGYAVFAFTPSTTFPGANALYPAVGTALLLHAGNSPKSVVARWLSLAPLAFVGLISYSLYLWHWVLIVFARYASVAPLSSTQTAVVVLASVVIAILSWRYIEGPFRGRGGMGTRRQIFAGAATISLSLACVGMAGYLLRGFPRRFSPAHRALMQVDDAFWGQRKECEGSTCRVGDPSAPTTFMLWGDSHARSLAPAVQRAALAVGQSGFVETHSACAPLFGLRRYDPDARGCEMLEDSVRALIRGGHVQRVYLHARWALYVEGLRYREEGGAPVLLTPSKRPQDDAAAFERLLRATLKQLRDLRVQVTIIASVPEVGLPVPRLLVRKAITSSSFAIGPTQADFDQRQHRTLAILRNVAREFNVPLVYPHQVLCRSGTCSVERDGHSLYVDTDHLSGYGAAELVPLLESALASGSPASMPVANGP